MKQANATKVVEVPVSAVELPADGGIRQYYNQESLDELGKSLSDQGGLYPLIVRPKTQNKYELIAGSRRLRAAQKLGFDKINVVILTGIDDRRSLEISLAENMHREDLTPFEEARVILKFINDYKMPLQEIAKKISRSESFVRRRLQLLSLPKEIQKLIAEKKLSMAHIDTFVGMASSEDQVELAREAAEDSLSVDELAVLKDEKSKGKKNRKNNPAGGKLISKNKVEQNQNRKKHKGANGKKVRLQIARFNGWLREAMRDCAEYFPLDKERIAKELQNLNSSIDKALKDLK